MGDIAIDTATADDLPQLLQLYRVLNPGDPVLPIDNALLEHWHAILQNPALIYVVARDEDKLAATCALTIIPNLTRSCRPYGLIENVVTHPAYRRRGIGTSLLHFAVEAAWQRDCYKVMLLSGRREEVLRFYDRAGFERDKTGFVVRNSGSSRPNEREEGR